MKFTYYLLATFLLVSSNSVAETLNDEQVKAIIEDLQEAISKRYVEPMKIPEINSYLNELVEKTAIADEVEASTLVQILTDSLAKFDPHFSVSEMPEAVTQSSNQPSWYQRLAEQDFGFTRAEILAENIGIVSFWGFAELNKRSKQKVDRVIRILRNVDGLIIDLRGNGGGSAEMVQYLSSYFLSGRVHLNSFYSRLTDQTTDYYTFEEIELPHLNTIPITVLIDAKTFSAAEEFAYNFKHLGRAIIIGNKSKGGANPWQFYPLKHGLRVAIPTSKAVNPITKSNWEGLGVIPHWTIEPSKAEDVAYRLILSSLLARNQ